MLKIFCFAKLRFNYENLERISLNIKRLNNTLCEIFNFNISDTLKICVYIVVFSQNKYESLITSNTLDYGRDSLLVRQTHRIFALEKNKKARCDQCKSRDLRAAPMLDLHKSYYVVSD